MINIIYDEHCAYKPNELGLQIAQHLTNKIIPASFRFLGYEDRVVKDGDVICDDKHACMLLCLDDSDGTETDLKPMNDIAALLVSDKKINEDCRPSEGIYLLSDDAGKKYKIFGEDGDKRVKVMFLDYALFKKHLEESKAMASNYDRFAYDSAQCCYYSISNINENGINQFEENGLDYLETFKKEEFAYAGEFVKKYWPNNWQEFSITSVPLDMRRRFYDEEDKVWRRRWKYCFKITDSSGKEICGDHALRTVSLPELTSESTMADYAKAIEYYVDTGSICETDLVMTVTSSNMSMLFIKAEDGKDEKLANEFACVKSVISNLKDSSEKMYDMTFTDNIEEFLKNNKDMIAGKISCISFGAEQIF